MNKNLSFLPIILVYVLGNVLVSYSVMLITLAHVSSTIPQGDTNPVEVLMHGCNFLIDTIVGETVFITGITP